jgi:hypothetical protein
MALRAARRGCESAGADSRISRVDHGNRGDPALNCGRRGGNRRPTTIRRGTGRETRAISHSDPSRDRWGVGELAEAGRRAWMGRWGDGEMGRWGDGEMGRWGDGEMGRWGDGEMGGFMFALHITRGSWAARSRSDGGCAGRVLRVRAGVCRGLHWISAYDVIEDSIQLLWKLMDSRSGPPARHRERRNKG